MIWLLDLIEDHRAAVKYDLLAHGYRLEWLATPALPWGDAVTIIAMQLPGKSAVYRETHPDDYDRDKKLERLEQLAVILVRGQMLTGNQTEVGDGDLPKSYDDLFEKVTPVEQRPVLELLTFDEIDARMGWAN